MAKRYLQYVIIRSETRSEVSELIAAFASWLDADAFLDLRVEEERKCGDCCEVTRSEGLRDCFDPANPDQRVTYSIRKLL